MKFKTLFSSDQLTSIEVSCDTFGAKIEVKGTIEDETFAVIDADVAAITAISIAHPLIKIC